MYTVIYGRSIKRDATFVGDFFDNRGVVFGFVNTASFLDDESNFVICTQYQTDVLAFGIQHAPDMEIFYKADMTPEELYELRTVTLPSLRELFDYGLDRDSTDSDEDIVYQALAQKTHREVLMYFGNKVLEKKLLTNDLRA